MSIIVSGFGIYEAEANLLSAGLELIGLGSVSTIVFGILARKKEKGAAASGLGLGFGIVMGIVAVVAALAIVVAIGWIFLTFGFG